MPYLTNKNEVVYTTFEVMKKTGLSRFSIHNKANREKIGCVGKHIGFKNAFATRVKFFNEKELEILKADFREKKYWKRERNL